jgi:hypothetical protein
MCSVSYFFTVLTITEMCRQILVQTEFHANASGWSRVVPFGRADGRIDMTGLLVAFCNCFASRLQFKTQKGLL